MTTAIIATPFGHRFSRETSGLNTTFTYGPRFDYHDTGAYSALRYYMPTGVSDTSLVIQSATHSLNLLSLAPVSFSIPFDVEFQTYADEWKQESQFMSSPDQVASLPAYKRIIGMGQAVVPFILKSLQKEPALWFDALMAITNAQPVAKAHAGDLKAMANDWLIWGKRNGVL